jgi:hypothetical protein
MLPRKFTGKKEFLWINGEAKTEEVKHGKFLKKCDATLLGFKIQASCSMKYWFMCLINSTIKTVPKAKFTSSFESK